MPAGVEHQLLQVLQAEAEVVLLQQEQQDHTMEEQAAVAMAASAIAQLQVQLVHLIQGAEAADLDKQ
jgi:hypothetical protein